MQEQEQLRLTTAIYTEANKGRDFDGYQDLMDAATEAKVRSLFPLFGKVPENATIVDLGSGTGAVAERAAIEFRGSRVFAVDYSHEMLRRMARNRGLLNLVYGDIVDPHLPDNSVDVMYSSTSFHEVNTFQGEERLRLLFRNAFRQVKPGAVFAARDFADPDMADPLLMYLPPDSGIDDIARATTDGIIDYSKLSKRALFERFHREFKGGDAFQYERITMGSKEMYLVKPKWIYEFGERKDYTVNWRQEIKEEFGIGTKNKIGEMLEGVGFKADVFDDDSDFIRKYRINDKIHIFAINATGKLIEIPFFVSHMKFRAVKPLSHYPLAVSHQLLDKTAPPQTTFDEIKQSIQLDERDGIINVRGNEFTIDTTRPVHKGSKKSVYWLKSTPPTVLKLIRTDPINGESALTAMIQAVERQHVLDEYTVPHFKVYDVDKNGPPYAYFTQEAIADDAECVADLIKSGSLSEEDIKQLARHINTFELTGEWQLDTNPYNWYRVTKADGSTELKYADGKVYIHEETWAFKKVGLLQWLSNKYLSKTDQKTAHIPSQEEYNTLCQEWDERSDKEALLWKKYLHPDLQPKIK